MAFVRVVVHKSIATVQNRRVIDEVKIAALGRKFKFSGTRNRFDGVEGFQLLITDNRQVSLSGMSRGADERCAPKIYR